MAHERTLELEQHFLLAHAARIRARSGLLLEEQEQEASLGLDMQEGVATDEQGGDALPEDIGDALPEDIGGALPEDIGGVLPEDTAMLEGFADGGNVVIDGAWSEGGGGE